jgi:uncharacterized integral membrane protein
MNNRLKGVIIFLLGVLLALFAWQNWQPPQPPVRLFGYEVLPLPQVLIIYLCLLAGFIAGWLAHGLRLRRKRRAAASGSQEAEPHQSQ